MAAAKGPVYKEKDVIINTELLSQLTDAVSVLEDAMKATIPIYLGTSESGFGVSKTQRGIAADTVISIARAIKGLKGW